MSLTSTSGRNVRERLQRFPGRSGRGGARAELLERQRHDFPRIRLVVDDQNFEAASSGCAPPAGGSGVRRMARTGSWTENAAPRLRPSLCDLHLPAVQLDDVPDDREAETQPAVRPRDRAVALPETIEDERQELRCNALAGVGDR